MHRCSICDKQFMYKYLLLRHNNNIRNCKGKQDKIINYELIKSNYTLQINNMNNIVKRNEENYDQNKCGYCKKIYSNKSNLKVHIKNSCKVRISIISEIKELTIKLNIIIKNELQNIQNLQILHENPDNKKTLQKIKNITNNNTNNINNTNNGVINNINITINPFGKEDLSHITDDQYIRYMKDIFPGFLNFIKKIYYDDSMPSNQNMCIKNLRSNHGYIYQDNQWNAIKRDEMIDSLIKQKTKILNNKFNELEENNKTTDDLEEAFTHFISKMRKSKDEGKDNLIDDLILLLYNQRSRIEKLESIMKENT